MRDSLIDYVIRDLAFAGRLSIHMDIEGLVADVCPEHPDWVLLDSLDSYLLDTLYGEVEIQTIYALLQRAIAELLIRQKISLEELFGTDPASAISDDSLRDRLCKYKVGREIVDAKTRDSWKTWTIDTSLPVATTPYEFERHINGQTKT